MIYLTIALVGVVGLFLRKRHLKRKRLYEALQMFVDELVELYDYESNEPRA